jgi:hypothetical protein
VRINKAHKMKNNNKNIIAAIILGVSIVVAAYILASSKRWVVHKEYPIAIDRWTGEYKKLL